MQIIAQILINSVVSGLIVSLVAIGFTYIFKITRVFHFAHGGIYVVGAFASWWLYSICGNLIVSIFFAVLLNILIIFLVEKFVYLPFTKEKTDQTISLISSLGIFIIIVNSIALVFGNDIKNFGLGQNTLVHIGEIMISNIQLIQVLISVILIAATAYYLKYSKSDLVLQAISDNITTSMTYGINIEKERIKVLIFGSILAVIASILNAIEFGFDPNSGLEITLVAAVIAIFISRLSLMHILVSSILLIVLQNSVEWFFSAQWRSGITFLILLFVIIYKTDGILSYKLRKD